MYEHKRNVKLTIQHCTPAINAISGQLLAHTPITLRLPLSLLLLLSVTPAACLIPRWRLRRVTPHSPPHPTGRCLCAWRTRRPIPKRRSPRRCPRLLPPRHPCQPPLSQVRPSDPAAAAATPVAAVVVALAALRQGRTRPGSTTRSPGRSQRRWAAPRRRRVTPYRQRTPSLGRPSRPRRTRRRDWMRSRMPV